MADHPVCHAHCPPKAAGGLGVLAAVVAGGLLLDQAPVAAAAGAVLHAVLMVLMWTGITAGAAVAVFAGWRLRRRAVSHSAVSGRRAMRGYGRRAVRPAPLALARPVSRVTAVTIKPTEAKVKR